MKTSSGKEDSAASQALTVLDRPHCQNKREELAEMNLLQEPSAVVVREQKPITCLGGTTKMKGIGQPQNLSCNKSSSDQMIRSVFFTTVSRTDTLLKLEGAAEVFWERGPGDAVINTH